MLQSHQAAQPRSGDLEQETSVAMLAFKEERRCAQSRDAEYATQAMQPMCSHCDLKCRCVRTDGRIEDQACRREPGLKVLHGAQRNSYSIESLLRPETGSSRVNLKDSLCPGRHSLGMKRKSLECDADEHVCKLASPAAQQDEKTACQVHGIFSRPGCRDPKYTVTFEELQRRVSQPECLTKVDMIAYVRLAKNSARILLEKHGVKTNQQNQRSEHTILSKVCEAEARTLAEGIRDMNYRHFPSRWLASRTLDDLTYERERGTYKDSMLQKLKDSSVAKHVLLNLYFGIEKRRNDPAMAAFDRISHSFGVNNVQEHVLFILSCLEEERRAIKESL